MWSPDEKAAFLATTTKEQESNVIKFRSHSPPFEGGESLCEFYGDPSDTNEELPQFQRPLSKNRDVSPCNEPPVMAGVYHPNGEEKFPNRSFLSLLNQDLLPAGSFTQTFLQSILSSVDSTDPVVANAWMETLLDVIDLLPKEIVKNEILTLAVNKGQMSQPVPSRLLCCKMLGKICLKFDPYVIKKEVLPVVLSLCQDVDFEVRGYMCRQLDVVAKGIGLEATKSAILPELVELANDKETFVRLAGIETVVQMLPLLDDDICIQTIIPLVKKLCENSLHRKDSTLPVIAKQFGRLCCGLTDVFTPEEKDWFLNFFQDLSHLGISNSEKSVHLRCSPMPDLLPAVEHKDHYQECRNACAYNFPAMVLFNGMEHFEMDLYATFKNLCSDPSVPVRQTIAHGFFEITRLLKSKSYLVQDELVILLQDNSIEILKGLIPSLPSCLKAVCSKIDTEDDSKSSIVKALIACEETTSVTSNWRLHADFLSCLSCLPFCISSETIFTAFVPLLILKLHTARPIPCRTAAAYSLLVFLRNTPSLERRKSVINELIRELCNGRSCHKRMLFLRVCELVIELFSKVFFKLHFFKPLLSLSADPVANIRLKLCWMLPELKSLMKLPKDSRLLQQLESCVKSLMLKEEDRDVKYAVRKAIAELDKIEVSAEPLSRRSSCIEISLDIEDQLKENEERQQLEMEFNTKLCKDNVPHSPIILRSANKAGRIPVRKSGTLPKSSKPVDLPSGTCEKIIKSNSQSLRILKKERRISTPVMNIDFQKNTPHNVLSSSSKEENRSKDLTVLKTTLLKCSPNTPKSNPNMRTWPRQRRSSCIPQQFLDRCPSPMPQNRRFSVNFQSEFQKQSLNSAVAKETNCTKSEISTPKRYSFSGTLDRKIKTGTILPSPELLRKSATISNINSESKIPTTFLRKVPEIKVKAQRKKGSSAIT